MTRRLISLINNNSENLPANKKFLVDVMSAIEQIESKNRRNPSTYYKPSSLKCMRNMYYTRIGAETDKTTSDYNLIGMANTGTARHESIQDVLLQMNKLHYDWEYIDVGQYVKEKQMNGLCESLKVLETKGAETHLIDTVLHLSFRCDGIIKRISTDEYFLFEMKNVTSFKFNTLEGSPLDEHKKQVICYCTALDLENVFVLYENRDFCTLECEFYHVTDEMKNDFASYIIECEDYVSQLNPPERTQDKKICRYCNYKTVCEKE